MPPEAAVRVILVKRSANDPKRTFISRLVTYPNGRPKKVKAHIARRYTLIRDCIPATVRTQPEACREYSRTWSREIQLPTLKSFQP